MAGKKIHSQYSPKINAPLDGRLSVKDKQSREWIDGKYRSMEVYQEDEDTKYVLVKNANSSNLNDPLNRKKLSEIGMVGRHDYGIINLSDRGNVSQTSIDYNLNYGDGSRLYKGIINGEYNNSLIAIIEYDRNTMEEVVKHNPILIQSESDIFTYMQENCANNGTSYTYSIKGYVYDYIDSTIPTINKINGINVFYSVLIGKRNYKRSTYPRLDYGDSSYINRKDFIESAIRKLTPNTAYIYNDDDKPRKAIWTPRNHRTLYGLLNGDGIVNNLSIERYSINTGNVFSNVMGYYSVNHNNSYYCVLDLTTLAFFWINKSEISQIMGFITHPNYSVIAVYQLQLGDNYSIFIKPVGIDSVYLDYVDYNLYDIYAIHHARNQYISLQQVNIKSADMAGKNTRVLKKDWMYQQSSGKSKGGYRELPNTNFILKRKSDNMVGQKSNATIKRRSGRDRGIYASINY